MRKKFTLLFASFFLMMGSAWAEVDYTPRNTGTNENGRRINKVKLESPILGVFEYSLTDGEKLQDYLDLTTTQVFKAKAGEELTASMERSGNWTNAFVYIDVDNNGFEASIATDGYTAAKDLVSYSFYSGNDDDDSSGKNSAGEEFTGPQRNTMSLPTFKAPTTAGTYRMRFKMDWNSIDPAGDENKTNNDFKGNGGRIIDVMLEVLAENSYAVLAPNGFTVTYKGVAYSNGDSFSADGDLADSDFIVAGEREGYVANVEVDKEKKTVHVVLTLTLKAGDKLILKNKQHNVYFGLKIEGGKLDNSVPPTTKQLGSYQTNNNYKNCWELVAATHDDKSCFYLYNPYYDWYAGAISERNKAVPLAKTAETAGRYLVEVVGDYIAIKCLNGANTGHVYLHQVDWGGYAIVDWDEDADASQWTFELVSANTENGWLEAMSTEMENKKAELGKYVLGNGIGQYTGMTEAEKTATLAALTIPTEGTAASRIKAGVYALEDFQGKLNSLEINMPAAGFYRIASQNSGLHTENKGKYIQNSVLHFGKDEKMSALKLDNTADANSIMYYDGRTILSYASGLYINRYFYEASEAGVSEVIGAVGTEPSVWTIVENAQVVGTYALKYNQDGWFMSDWDSDVRTTYGNNDVNAAWIFEEVTELPVAVTAAGYATLYAPVALTIAENVTAYSAAVEDEYLVLNKVEGTIPANTGVIIEAEEGSYNFAVADAVAAIKGNALTGAVAKSVKNAEKSVYTLQKPTDKEVGFYLFKGQNASGETTYINGFRAWVELDADSPVKALSLRGEGTTGIQNSELTIQNSEIIYDLLGRRVEAMTKGGIYIVNGKKVIK